MNISLFCAINLNMTNLKEAAHRLIYTARMMSWMVDPRMLLPPPDYKIDRPIFLLGTQGGGLTLLARMLQRHPDVISAAGNASYWTAANELQNVYGPALPLDLTGLRYKAPPHPILTAPRSWTFATKDLLPLYRRTSANNDVKATLLRFIRLSALRHAPNLNRFRFMDKSQVFSVRVGMLHDICPDACFILVPRDPYVSVYRAATGKAGDMQRLSATLPLAERLRLCAEHYANSMQAVFDDVEARGIKLHLIPFETLLQQPEKSLRDVCAFTGLEFSPDMLPQATHRMPLGSRFLDRWYPIRADVNNVYSNKIGQDVIDVVNQYAGDLIEKLGYAKR